MDKAKENLSGAPKVVRGGVDAAQRALHRNVWAIEGCKMARGFDRRGAGKAKRHGSDGIVPSEPFSSE